MYSARLPSEVWCNIAQYLTKEQLRRMYSVNRAFYHIAMSLRYREMSIGDFHGSEGTDIFKCYILSDIFYYHIPLESGNPELAQHVKSLKLNPTPAGSILGDEHITRHRSSRKTTPKFPILRLLIRGAELVRRRSRGSNREKLPGPTQTVERLRDFIFTLNRLTKLTIQWDSSQGGVPEYLTEPSQLLITVGWKSYGSNLRHLELSMDLEMYGTILTPSLYFDNLEYLTFWLDIFYNNTDDTLILQSHLVPFVKKHRDKLKGFALNLARNLNMKAFFSGIGYLPQLEKLHMSQPYFGVLYRHMDAFNLDLYADTLTELRWYFHDAPNPRFHAPAITWFTYSPYNIILPHLTHLELGLNGIPLPEYFENLIFYITNHRHTLTKLILDGSAFSLNQLHLLSKASSSPLLVEFAISLEYLGSAAISVIHQHFPNLEVLHLTFSGLDSCHWDPTAQMYVDDSILDIVTSEYMDSRLDKFQRDMQTLAPEWLDWTLGNFFLRGGCPYFWTQRRAWRVQEIILVNLPCIGFLNGKYRECVLEEVK